MACNCGKNRTQPTGMTASRQKAQEAANNAAEKARAENHSTTRIGPKQPMQGTTQQFALRTPSGKSVRGSRLEVLAARTRAGGGEITPV